MANEMELGQRLMQGFPPPADGQVTLANWRLPPFNRWAFHNVRQIGPTAAIYRGAVASQLGRDPHPVEMGPFQGPDGKEWTIGRVLPATSRPTC